MWSNLSTENQAWLWVILIICAFVLLLRLLRVLEQRSKRIIVMQADGSRLEFRGLSAEEASRLNEAARQAAAVKATADDVR